MNDTAIEKQESRVQVYAEKERENNFQITDLIAEKRDAVMRRHLEVGDKFMNRIDKLLDEEDDPKYLGSLARTFDVVANTMSRAAKFDHVAKPAPEEQVHTKVNLFVQCAPVGLSPEKETEVTCIDIQADER